MAQLTPLSKGLLGLFVVGCMASAVWHLALKQRFGTSPDGTLPTPVAATPDPVAGASARRAADPAPAATQPKPPERAPQEPRKPADVANPPVPQTTAPQTSASKQPAAPSDPWAELKIEKKGNKP